jgi:hypothetical protein
VQTRIDALASDLCAMFLGWRLREDHDALFSLEEGALRIDLASGECWCDGDPLPPLFIAGELRSAIQRAGAAFQNATLDAEFAKRSAWIRGEPRPALDLACRVQLETETGIQAFSEANNSASR